MVTDILESFKFPKMVSPLFDLDENFLNEHLGLTISDTPSSDSGIENLSNNFIEEDILIHMAKADEHKISTTTEDINLRSSNLDSITCSETNIRAVNSNEVPCVKIDENMETIAPALEVEQTNIMLDIKESEQLETINSILPTENFAFITQKLLEVTENISPLTSDPIDVANQQVITLPTKETDSTKGFELAVITNNAEEFDNLNYSPSSPLPADRFSTEITPIIPSYTQSPTISRHIDETPTELNDLMNSTIDRIIKSYSQNIRSTLLENLNSTPSADDAYLLASLRNAIESYCTNEWSSETVTICVDKMLGLSERPKYLATSILEVIEDTCDPVSIEFTPPAPALPLSHQKCLVLVKRITHQIPSFDKYVEHQLERNLFSFTQSLNVPAMINLAHFYIGLIDVEQPSDKSKVRLFIYKCLYYYSHKATPLIYTMLLAHPYVLPHAHSVETITDPLIQTIVCILTNTSYSVTTSYEQNCKKNEMYFILKVRYGYFANKSFPIQNVVEHCIECIRSNRLLNVDYALILLAKRQGCDWAITSVIDKYLIPLLHQYMSSEIATNTEHDKQICVILNTIGSIIKTYPLDQKIDYHLNIFIACLNATDRQMIQEAAVTAICQMCRFGVAQVYECLSHWKPTFDVSPKIMAMLNTMVYQKNKNFWYSN